MDDFFSNDDYEIPTTSNYMRFEEGDNKFRILGSFKDGTAIMGTEYWVTKGAKRSPKRLPMGVPVPNSELEINNFGDLERPKHFWALPVYNYQDKRIQVLEITQASVQKAILTLIRNVKWGDPRNYDIVVSQLKDKLITYNVVPDPKEPISKEIRDAYKNTYINMKALFSGQDPFKKGENESAEDMPWEESASKEDINPDEIPL